MTPSQFRSRYLASLPVVPPGIELHLDEFFIYPADEVDSLPISMIDRQILTVSGLPRSGPQFMNFGGFKDVLSRMSHHDLGSAYDRYRIIGSNGSGDTICIDEATGGEVVYLNHDLGMARVFINSSVSSLAACICIFQEQVRVGQVDDCRAAMREVDPSAVDKGSFWDAEIEAHWEDEVG